MSCFKHSRQRKLQVGVIANLAILRLRKINLPPPTTKLSFGSGWTCTEVHSSLGFHLWCRARLQATSIPGVSKLSRVSMFIRTQLQQFIRITTNYPILPHKRGVEQARRLLAQYQEIGHFIRGKEHLLPLGAIRAFFRAYRITNRVFRWLIRKQNNNELFQNRSAPLCQIDSLREYDLPSVPVLPRSFLRTFVGRQA